MQMFSGAPRSTQPRCSCGDLRRPDGVKHIDIDGQALVWCAAKRSKTVALAQPSALFALPANAGAGVWRHARSWGGRSPLPCAGCRARARFLRRCPFARCATLTARATPCLDSPRSSAAAAGRRPSRPSTRRPPPITYEFGRRRWSRASSAPASARRAARCASLAMALRCPTRLLAGAPLVCASILEPGGDLWRSRHLLLELRTRLDGCEAIGARRERCERCARCPSE